jgi:hypothetical protein
MREQQVDLWEAMHYPETSAICIPTNGTVKRNGEAVMGRGVALQAQNRWHQIPRILGNWLRTTGDVAGPHLFVIPAQSLPQQPCDLVCFPVKYAWHEKASLELIAQSCRELQDTIEMFQWSTVYLPRPGCGNGGRTWDEVYPIVATLDDRVSVVTL